MTSSDREPDFMVFNRKRTELERERLGKVARLENRVVELEEAYEAWRAFGQKSGDALLSIWRIFGDRAHMTYGHDPQVVVDEVVRFVSGQLNPLKSSSRPGCASQMYKDEEVSR